MSHNNCYATLESIVLMNPLCLHKHTQSQKEACFFFRLFVTLVDEVIGYQLLWVVTPAFLLTVVTHGNWPDEIVAQ